MNAPNLAPVIFCILIAAVSFMAGWQFSRGKWLRLVAGNTFLKREDIDTEIQKKNGRYVGKALYAGAFMMLSIGLTGILSTQNSAFVALGIILLIVSIPLFIISIVRVLKYSEPITK